MASPRPDFFMKTIRTTLDEMKKVVATSQTMPPTWWLDRAMELGVLWQDLKEEMTKYEMAYKSEIGKLTEENSVAKANLLVEGSSDNYYKYKYLKGRDEVIAEFIKLAKARGKLEDYL